MRENVKYWIWLAQVLGAGARVDEISEAYPDPERLYRAGGRDRVLSGVFTRRQLEKLDETSLRDAENAVKICERNGWNVVVASDLIYPAGLRTLSDRPLVLYVDGDVSVLRGKIIIGVVGTRKPSRESEEITRKITADMTRAGAVVVSGGALGIDSAAHEGALSVGGKTVCVLGCGLGTNYLASNEALRRRIKKNGALICEYPPFTAAAKATFPMRNRIISGVSHGVLVVEAGEKSGSLITARRAVDQGRDVFAVPGSAFTRDYSGANKLIRDGAKAVMGAKDVLESYAAAYPDRIDMSALENEPPAAPAETKRGRSETPRFKNAQRPELDPDDSKIYELFKSGEALCADDICVQTDIPLPRTIAALTNLEIADLIKRSNGESYEISN